MLPTSCSMLSTAAAVLALMQSKAVIAASFTTLPNIAPNCNKWYVAIKGDGCWAAYSSAGITADQFYKWNPDVPTTCASNFFPDYGYCIGIDSSLPSTRPATTVSSTALTSTTRLSTTSKSSSTQSTSKPPTATTNTDPYTILHPVTGWNITSTTVETTFPPTRTQSGQPQNCNNWHYVGGGETCQTICNRYNMNMDDLLDWNPSLMDDCAGLQIGWWVCIHTQPQTQVSIVLNPPDTSAVIPTPTTYTTPATPSVPSFTPVPSHGAMPANCKSWYFSQAGDRCDNVLAKNPLMSRSQFFEWNPVLNGNCDGLWNGVYYCVWAGDDAASGLPAPATISSRPANAPGSSTSDCAAWYPASNGDSCQLIVDMFGRFSQADFLSWNPAVGSDCAGIKDDTYYCVGVAGTPTTRTAAAPSATSTPTEAPTQSGLAAECTSLWLVSSTDTCQSIARAKGISLSDFLTWNPSVGTSMTCSNLKPDYNVCVMVKGGTGLPPSATGVIRTSTSAAASSASSTQAATPSAPTSSPTGNPLVVSTDGTCSGTAGFTCVGSTFGKCCSPAGWCGDSTAHCGTGCQTGFSSGCSTDGAIKVSPDATCGGANGYTCAGSGFGDCCSSSGWCGSSDAHCGASCVPEFGKCPVSDKPPSSDGTCGGTQGFTCIGSGLGDCCSQYGWCGSSTNHCGTGCQSGFGKCT